MFPIYQGMASPLTFFDTNASKRSYSGNNVSVMRRTNLTNEVLDSTSCEKNGFAGQSRELLKKA